MPGLFSSESLISVIITTVLRLWPNFSIQLSSEVVGAAELWMGKMSGTRAAGLLPEQLGPAGGGHLIICR